MLMDKVLNYYGYNSVTRYICVLEKVGKRGEVVDPHFHINLEVPDHSKSKDNFQKVIRKWTAGIKGNAYMVRYVEDPEDEDRWWRYCLKELDAPCWFSKKGFEKEWIDLAKKLACDERSRTQEFNRAATERLLQKETFRLKMFKNLTVSLAKVPRSANFDRQIYCMIIRYYQDNNKTPPFNNLDNIVIDYKLVEEFMTPEEYFNIRH